MARRLIVLAVFVGLALPGSLDAAEPGCATTHTNGSAPPGEAGLASTHGRGGLWTTFATDGHLRITDAPPVPDGMTFGTVHADGSLETKFPWWGSRRAAHRIVIRGRRLDGVAVPFEKHYRDHAGATSAPHFWATRLRFSRAGCWRVSARSGRAHLSFVVSVEPAAR